MQVFALTHLTRNTEVQLAFSLKIRSLGSIYQQSDSRNSWTCIEYCSHCEIKTSNLL
jgi:hypothetical protein